MPNALEFAECRFYLYSENFVVFFSSVWLDPSPFGRTINEFGPIQIQKRTHSKNQFSTMIPNSKCVFNGCRVHIYICFSVNWCVFHRRLTLSKTICQFTIYNDAWQCSYGCDWYVISAIVNAHWYCFLFPSFHFKVLKIKRSMLMKVWYDCNRLSFAVSGWYVIIVLLGYGNTAKKNWPKWDHSELMIGEKSNSKEIHLKKPSFFFF